MGMVNLEPNHGSLIYQMKDFHTPVTEILELWTVDALFIIFVIAVIFLETLQKENESLWFKNPGFCSEMASQCLL